MKKAPTKVDAFFLKKPNNKDIKMFVSDAAEQIGMDGTIACHSLRKTWGYHAWTSKSVSPVVIMHIYNHSSFEVTQRYLGVAQDDLDKAYLGMELF